MTSRWRILLALLFIALSSCVHIEMMHSGIVKDAETQKPLNNTIVYLELHDKCYLPPSPGGPDRERLGNIEVKTDDNGKFYLPLKVYLMPPLLCFTDKYFAGIRAGYFSTAGWKTSNQLGLFRMTHYLNYLPYKSPDRFYLSSQVESESELFKPELRKLRNIAPEPLDGMGIFLRLPGKIINRIYSRSMRGIEGILDGKVYYAQDDISKSWITFDSRGRILALKADLPSWTYMSSQISWGNPVYVDRDLIYYPIDDNPIPLGFQNIPSYAGKISNLFGDRNTIYTFENNGTVMCRYNRHYKVTPNMNSNTSGPFLVTCYSGVDLPAAAADDTVKDSIFKFASETLNHGIFIITKSPRAWHVYIYGVAYDERNKHMALLFREIYSLSVEKEITAFAATGNDFYVAFKKEGLRKYRIIGRQGFNVDVAEDTSFARNAEMTKALNINSLIYSFAVNVSALYATTGEDRIYRFSEDGIPDYILKQQD